MARPGRLVSTFVATTLALSAFGAFAGCTPRPAPSEPGARTAPPSVPASVSEPAPQPLDASAYPDGRPLRPVPDVRPAGVVDPPPGVGLDRYTAQRVRWRACGSGQCALVLAPLDYAHPDRAAVQLAVKRVRADGGPSRGTVVVNPGGPGGSGREMVDQLGNRELRGFDLIGWDPRGIGGSARVRCDEDLTARYAEADASPTDPAQLAALVQSARAFGRSCLELSGELLAHVSTVEHVADLELLRGLLGLARVDSFGASYGSALVSLYAATHPDRAGRMVLDSVFDLDGDLDRAEVGTERQIRALAALCAHLRCRLGPDRDAVLARIGRLLADLDATPLVVGDRQLTQQQAVVAVTSALYEREGEWTVVTRALESALDGDGGPLLARYDVVSGRDADGHYPVLPAFAATVCADSADASVRRQLTVRAEQSARSPVLGPYVGASLLCTQWPVAPVPHRAVASGTARLLLVQNSGDNATPVEWARTVAARFPASRLLVAEGDGHIALDDSSCVQQHVVAYLATGELPPPGTTCPA
jgi:pimeloyl-ACP methyl ester carboxylesterase